MIWMGVEDRAPGVLLESRHVPKLGRFDVAEKEEFPNPGESCLTIVNPESQQEKNISNQRSKAAKIASDNNGGRR